MKTEIILAGLSYAFLLTVAVEGAVTLIFTRQKVFLLYNLCCNALTNPLLNVVGLALAYKMQGFDAKLYYTAGELLVLFAEAALYAFFDNKRHSKKYYFCLSLLTNAASLAAGVLFLRF